jgi:hypothetical protein
MSPLTLPCDYSLKDVTLNERFVQILQRTFEHSARGEQMIITIWNGQSFDTDRDLTSAERHILQKLFIWKGMASSLEEFREKKHRALAIGWNNSGPVNESRPLRMIIEDLERQVVSRLKDD